MEGGGGGGRGEELGNERVVVVVVVCCLIKFPATCYYISGTDLLGQLFVLPYWGI